MDFREHEGSKWVNTSVLCERDGMKIYIEVLTDGTKTCHSSIKNIT
jgi:hypothetical protein